MRRPRSSARVNLRFRNLEEIDAIELRANQDGLDLQNWIRRLIRREMSDQEWRRHLMLDALRGLLTCLFILESIVDKQKVQVAKEKANEIIDRLENKIGRL